MNREIRRKERAEREVKQLKGDVDEKQKEIADLKEDKLIIQVCFSFLFGHFGWFFQAYTNTQNFAYDMIKISHIFKL